MARYATLVVQSIYKTLHPKLPLVLSVTVKLFDVSLVLMTICVINVAPSAENHTNTRLYREHYEGI